VLLLQLKVWPKEFGEKSLAEMGGVNFRSRFCLCFFTQIP
jgi:hypothetical protein